MGRVMDHHFQPLECPDIARPGDAPRLLLTRGTRDSEIQPAALVYNDLVDNVARSGIVQRLYK